MTEFHIDSATWKRITYLLEEHCPRFMRCGGGPLGRTNGRRPDFKKCKKSQKQIRELTAKGLSQKKIGARIGIHQAQVSSWQRQLGLKPNGKIVS